jgi:uncharacterized protein YbcI
VGGPISRLALAAAWRGRDPAGSLCVRDGRHSRGASTCLEVHVVRTLAGAQLAAITREMVRITSDGYGRGATEAKSYQCDEVVVCVMKGGLTPVERNLIDHGDEDLVRQLRLRFQVHNGAAYCDAVERIVEQRVLTYQSQVLFDPDYTVELFVLGDDGPRPTPVDSSV